MSVKVSETESEKEMPEKEKEMNEGQRAGTSANKSEPTEPRILLEEENPYGSYVAQLENDGRTIYLYLSPTGSPEEQPRAVWIRNLVAAPAETDREAMQVGMAPLYKKSACKHPDGLPPLTDDALDLVWFQEGNGVTLYHDGQIEAIIPPWSGKDGFFGYAREALSADIGTLPLPPQESEFYKRLEENLSFWNLRTQKGHWDNYRDRMLAHYEAALGPHLQYYAVTDRTYPPLAVVEFETSRGRVYTTLGMSNQNMPGVELAMENPRSHVRVEIITERRQAESFVPGLMGRMAVYPWLSGSWLGHGHLFESGLNEPFSDFVLTDNFAGSSLDLMDSFQVDSYNLRFILALPISQDWVQAARLRGGEHILRKIREMELE